MPPIIGPRDARSSTNLFTRLRSRLSLPPPVPLHSFPSPPPSFSPFARRPFRFDLYAPMSIAPHGIIKKLRLKRMSRSEKGESRSGARRRAGFQARATMAFSLLTARQRRARIVFFPRAKEMRFHFKRVNLYAKMLNYNRALITR